MSEDEAPARLAATVVLVRDGEAGPELFMVRRHHKNKFMANATVFVGGRVDEADRAPEVVGRCRGVTPAEAAERVGVDAETAIALYVAAVRETFEESGVLLGARVDGSAVSHDELAGERERLNSDQLSFAELLLADKLQLSLHRLRYLAHWITPKFEPRRFDTYFFAAEVPPGQRASYDARETTAGEWITPARLLEENRAKRVLLAPPTLCVIEELASARSAGEAVARAPDGPMPAIQPRPLVGGAAGIGDGSAASIVLLLPGDHRFDEPSSTSGPEHYVELCDGYWRRVRRV